MADLRVELSEQARAQLGKIDAWWRENRTSSPDLFVRELEHAVATLAENRNPGVIYDGDRKVRRLLLSRCHYHVYFVLEGDVQYVIAIWNAFRGRGPTL